MVPDEVDLLRRLRSPATKEQAFVQVINTWKQGLYWHIRQIIPDHSDADDVLQNTLIKAWNNLDNFQGQSKIRTWLYKIGTNEALNWLASRKRFVSLEAETAETMGFTYTSGPALGMQDPETLLAEALEQLPPRQKMVFNMKYYDEMTYEEITEVIGGTTGSHKASFHHAVKKIEAHIQRSLNLSPH